MKKIYYLVMLPILCLLCACNEDSVSELTGKYDMDRYLFTRAETQPTEKLGGGVKALNVTLTDDAGNQLMLRVGSNEWVLLEGVYTWAETVAAHRQYSATLKEGAGTTSSTTGTTKSVTGGTLEVTLVGDTYYILGLLETAGGGVFKCDYKGSLSFEIGEDDPEPSGYTVVLATSPVTTTDEFWNTIVHEGVTKYTFTIQDPDGEEAALFDAINVENMETPALAGTYTIQGSPTEPWLMDNGWAFPEWNIAGGSYYVDDAGVKQYITSGQITVSVAESLDGDKLYSFSGNGLGVVTSEGDESGGGSFNIRFCTLQ